MNADSHVGALSEFLAHVKRCQSSHLQHSFSIVNSVKPWMLRFSDEESVAILRVSRGIEAVENREHF